MPAPTPSRAWLFPSAAGRFRSGGAGWSGPAGQGQLELVAVRGPGPLDGEARLVQLGGQRHRVELGADLGAHLLAGSEVHLDAEVGHGDRPFVAGAQPHLDAVLVLVPAGDVVEAGRVEVGAELPVEDGQDVAVELGGHPGSVVVGGHQSAPVLDQVGPQQQGVPGGHRPVEVGEEDLPAGGVQVPDGPAQEGHQPSTPAAEVAEVVEEVAHHGVDGQARVLGGQGGGRLPQHGVADVQGDVGAEQAGAGHGVQQQPGLVAGARPQLDQGVGAGRGDHVHSVGLEDGALGPGRVVLGQTGDLVEEPAAPVVVEVDRRELLGLGGQAGPDVGLHGRPQVGRGEVDLDGGGDDVGHGRPDRVGRAPEVAGPAPPVRCCWSDVRRSDVHWSDVAGEAQPGEGPPGPGREEVAVGGPGVAGRGGARAAPEHVLVHHELAVVLAHRSGRRDEAGVGGIGRRGPLPDIPQGVGGRTGRCRGQDLEVEEAGGGEDAGTGPQSAGRHRLPLGLGGETGPGPPGEGVGLEEADVADRAGRIDRPLAGQGELVPPGGPLGPVEGSRPSLGGGRGPPLGQPQLRALVAAVVHEGQPLAGGDRPVAQCEGDELDGVAG